MSEPTFSVPFVKSETVVTEELLDGDLRDLTLLRGDADDPGRCIILIHPRSPEGRWRPDVQSLRVDLQDGAEGGQASVGGQALPGPFPPTLGTDLRTLILDSVATGPVAEAYSVAGQPIREAGRLILAALAGLGG